MAALFKNPIERNSSGDPEEFRATLVEHLEELRTRIIRVVWMLVIGWIVSWYWVEPPLYGYLNQLIQTSVVPILKAKGIAYNEGFFNVTEPFMLKMKLSFMVGFIMVFPFAVLQVWGFIAPALKTNEKRPFKVIAPASFILFISGAAFAWWLLPNALKWFVSYVEEFPGTQLFQHAGVMVTFVLKMLLAFGLAFQLPVIVYALGAVGLLSTKTLMKYWRQSTLAIFVISAVITPSNDAFTMLMMALPMCVLFIISVYAVKLTRRKKDRDASSED
jgi:sec-independent protein translocase protein TatC